MCPNEDFFCCALSPAPNIHLSVTFQPTMLKLDALLCTKDRSKIRAPLTA